MRATLAALAIEIAAKHNLTVAELRGRDRARRVSWPRQELMAVARDRTDKTITQIARFLGRDHTTIMDGIRAHRERMAGQ